MIARALVPAMLVAATVAAQTTVTISGRVGDPAGEPVPRTTVTAVDPRLRCGDIRAFLGPNKSAAHYTTTMPGFILEEGTTNALTCSYD